MNGDDADLDIRLALLRSQEETRQLRAELANVSTLRNRLQEDVDSVKVSLSQLKGSVRFRLGSALVELAKGLRDWRRLFALIRSLAGVRANNEGYDRQREFIDAGGLPSKATREVASDVGEIFPVPSPVELPKRQSDLRVAAIMDPFSLASFGPECNLFPLHPDHWLDQMRDEQPHMLLVESAWTGMDGEWKGLVERAPHVLRSIVASCREAGIPTVFWNKEDPLHFEAFVATAKLFDHVFTTDAQSVPRYKRELRHDNVGVLPFALQPRTHHPIADGARLPSSVFAGAWYGNLPERCADFERVVDAIALAGPVVIHDRHDGGGSQHQRFPAKYRSSLRPSIPYVDTPALFRTHQIGINLNTIKQSPTMFARRALELIGCNTSVYGNHALGLRKMFGDLTVASNDPELLLKKAWDELRNPNRVAYRQRRLRALRKALREHTWSHRLHSIARAAWGAHAPGREMDGRIWVLASASDGHTLGRIVKTHGEQRGVKSTLVLALPPGLALPSGAVRVEDVRPMEGDWVAAFHNEDHYGPHYLEDLSLARAFGLADAVGKAAWFRSDSEGTLLQNPNEEYQFVSALAYRRSLWRYEASHGPLSALVSLIDAGEIRGLSMISLDAMNYVANGASGDFTRFDGPSVDEGIPWSDVEEFVAAMPAASNPAAEGVDALDGAQLAQLLNCGIVPEKTSASASGRMLEVCSLLKEGAEEAIFSAPLSRDVLERNGHVNVTLQAEQAPQLDVYLDTLNAEGAPVMRVELLRGVSKRLIPAPGTMGYRVALRLKGRFVQSVDGLWLKGFSAQPAILPGKRRIMLVCGGYPESSALYRNAFVHQRVLAYRAQGVDVDVVWVSEHERSRSYEFEGVLVQVCTPEEIAATLRISSHSSVAVHALDPVIWRAVSEASARRRVVVWLHGAEIQPWTRRAFNYQTEDARAQAIEDSNVRMAFWRNLLAQPPENLHLVFVSQRFADDVWADLGMRLPNDRWSVIHNPIDTNLFEYQPKHKDMRLRVLSIRPHASRIYANDLVASAINILSRERVFSSLEFSLVGDGPLWEENFASLEKYPNVSLQKGFLKQVDIARAHRTHGVFLVPTRGDTQGVSRDEAMSSGLVPVSCNVGAVAEFMDDRCGVLCPPESPEAIASAIIDIATNPNKFEVLSRAAAVRVRSQSAAHLVVAEELRLLGFCMQSVSSDNSSVVDFS